MKSAVGYGIDFGTSNSSIAVAFDDGSVEVLPVGTATMPHSLPSISYLHRDSNRLAGDDAINEFLITGSNRTLCDHCSLVVDDLEGRFSECRQFRPGGRCGDARLMYGLKSELSNDLFRVTHSWAEDFLMSDLVAIILASLKATADARNGVEIDTVVIGVPVAFIGTETGDFDALQDLAAGRLIESAEAAGFSDIHILEEPAAAVLGQPLAAGLSVALDFGGGTFDVAVIERSVETGPAEVIALQGAAVGGVEFDGLVFDDVVANAIGANQRLPAVMRQELRTLTGIRSLLSDPMVPQALASLKFEGGDTTALNELLFSGHAYDFYRTIEMAKIALSSVDETVIQFERPGIRVRESITRRRFETLIRPFIDAVEVAIGNALEEAEVEATEIHTVLRTGGSSELPAFQRLIEAVFPTAEWTNLPVFTAVAEGLGREAARRWAYV